MIKIPVIYEDQFLLVVDKPAGVIVHEGAGNPTSDQLSDFNLQRSPLLTDWIKEEHPDIVKAYASNPDPLYFRPGIVHRLDKDTSGLLVIAKTPDLGQKLQALFKNREVQKEYVTLVVGNPDPEEGSIVTFIVRNPRKRREMAVSFTGKGKESRTDYKTDQTWYYRYKGQNIPISLVTVSLHSGRMHQIRVHMKYKGWPVLGDQTYQTKPSRNIAKDWGLARQFLHAKRLSFTHPETGETVDVTSPLPNDLAIIKAKLEAL